MLEIVSKITKYVIEMKFLFQISQLILLVILFFHWQILIGIDIWIYICFSFLLSFMNKGIKNILSYIL